LRFAKPGPAYVPFVGDGDLADQLYKDRELWIADIDPSRIATAVARLNPKCSKVADCDQWPFPDCNEKFAVADFDAYANPYPAFSAFVSSTTIATRCVIFGTCGQRQDIKRGKNVIDLEAGTRQHGDGWREQYNFWWLRFVLPFLQKKVIPWTIVRHSHYLRNEMLYWGIVIEHPDATEKLDVSQVVDGRRVKFNGRKRAELLTLIASGKSLTSACGLIGVCRQTVYIYAREHPEFDMKLREAETERDVIMTSDAEEALIEAARNGNVVACQVILYNRAPGRWADKRNINIAGTDGEPFSLVHRIMWPHQVGELEDKHEPAITVDTSPAAAPDTAQSPDQSGKI